MQHVQTFHDLYNNQGCQNKNKGNIESKDMQEKIFLA